MKLRTKKQELYFDEAIRLHYEKGYGEDRIAKILPIGHTTVSRWITIFAAEKGVTTKIFRMTKSKAKEQTSSASEKDVKALQQEISRLQAQLKHETLRADAYDELINVAESKFRILIRKKAGTKR